MSTWNEDDLRQLKLLLHQLFRDAGYEEPRLTDWMEVWTEALQLTRKLEELQSENDRLKLELKKAQSAGSRREADRMSSKLRDALRE